LVEDVLSRAITRLVSQGKLHRIKGPRSCLVPSHSLYADDILIFCKGNLAGLRNLKDLFSQYALESGQVINSSKSTIFSGSITPGRLNLIVQLLNFELGSLPFDYLGVPIFKGKPKSLHLQPVADKIKQKLSAWKASLLSIAGRVQLVRSVVQSMLTYSISIYSWPISLLKDLEKCIRNFIWSGDSDKRKLVTVSWKKMCRPYSQGGLNIRSLIKLNEATNLKLGWDLLHSDSSWAKLLRARALRNGRPILHHIFSSLWAGVKTEYSNIKSNSVWIIGDGSSISFWHDNWSGSPLTSKLAIPDQVSGSLQATVRDFIFNNKWNIPPLLSRFFPSLQGILNSGSLPLDDPTDLLSWQHTVDGDMKLRDAYHFKSQFHYDLPWANIIWSNDIPPSRSLLVWRLMHGKLPTDENLRIRGCHGPSMCSLCHTTAESSFHIFFECDIAVKLWSWLAGCLDRPIQFYCIDDMWSLCDNGWAPQSKFTLTAAIINLINIVWMARNQARYHHKCITWKHAISMLISNTMLAGNHSKKVSSNAIKDFLFLKKFNINIHSPRPPILKEIIWHPPLPSWYKCNIDGASNGNPGTAACGGVFRNNYSDFVFAFVEPLGIATSFYAELSGALRAVEIAWEKGWMNLWLETDSSLVVSTFNKSNNSVAWSLRNRWRNVHIRLKDMNIMVSHIYREGNKVADTLANYGLTSPALTTWDEAPFFLRDSLESNKLGMPNFRICKS
jgi:ribonuclease HI